MKALVVDDSAGMRAFLKMVLKGAGIEVAEAKNGIEAAERSQLRPKGRPRVA